MRPWEDRVKSLRTQRLAMFLFQSYRRLVVITSKKGNSLYLETTEEKGWKALTGSNLRWTIGMILSLR